MKLVKFIFTAIFSLILFSCGPIDYFGELPKPSNCECGKCEIVVPPITVGYDPFVLKPLIEIKNSSGDIVASKYDFDPAKPQTIEVPCCTKIQIDVAWWEVCTAVRPVTAKLVELRAFVSPNSCIYTVNANSFSKHVTLCQIYPFQASF